MKKIIIISLIGFLVLPVVVLAQTAPTIDVMKALASITKWLWTFLLITAVICIIIAGYYFATAAGDPEKIRTAKNFVLYTIVGVVVAGMAWGIVSLIRKAVGG